MTTIYKELLAIVKEQGSLFFLDSANSNYIIDIYKSRHSSDTHDNKLLESHMKTIRATLSNSKTEYKKSIISNISLIYRQLSLRNQQNMDELDSVIIRRLDENSIINLDKNFVKQLKTRIAYYYDLYLYSHGVRYMKQILKYHIDHNINICKPHLKALRASYLICEDNQNEGDNIYITDSSIQVIMKVLNSANIIISGNKTPDFKTYLKIYNVITFENDFSYIFRKITQIYKLCPTLTRSELYLTIRFIYCFVDIKLIQSCCHIFYNFIVSREVFDIFPSHRSQTSHDIISVQPSLAIETLQSALEKYITNTINTEISKLPSPDINNMKQLQERYTAMVSINKTTKETLKQQLTSFIDALD